MKLGIFAKTFGRPTVEGVLDAVSELGLECVQFNLACAGLPTLPDALEDAILRRIRKAAETRRIELAAISGTFNLIHPDLRVRELGLQRLGILASACGILGTRLVTLCTGTRDPDDMWRAHPDNGSPEAWRELLASLERALGLAETWDITLAIEPELGNVVRSACHARRLLDTLRSPRLKILLDPANLAGPGEARLVGERMREAFELLGSDVVLAHAKELNPDGHAGGLAPGHGILDWDHYLSLLRATGFDGALVLHGFTEGDAASSVAFLRHKLRKAATPGQT